MNQRTKEREAILEEFRQWLGAGNSAISFARNHGYGKGWASKAIRDSGCASMHCHMPRNDREEHVRRLGAWLGEGKSLRGYARENGIPITTITKWCRSPKSVTLYTEEVPADRHLVKIGRTGTDAATRICLVVTNQATGRSFRCIVDLDEYRRLESQEACE